ncbi:MAG: STAS domain-containing protein [Clostridia bacterium]|nr:STAS domain-containing protein [Clostridia bacterium]
MKVFQPKLFSTFKKYGKGKLVNDLVAGVIVAIIALPLSIALAIASGVSPEQGLYTAIIAGFAISFFGGSNVNISGPTAAFATIVAGVVATHGVGGLVVATIMAGIILVLMGVLRLGSLIKYIPMTITTGFTAGIAVTIIIGQIKDFLGLTFAPGTNAIETIEKVEAIAHSFGTFNWQALLVGVVGMAILIGWPMLGKIKKLGVVATILGKIPASIIAVVVGVLLVQFTPLNGNVNTIGTLYPTLSSKFPLPSIPEISWDTVVAVAPSAFTIAILAAIESLLSCVVSDGMVGDKHNSNTELIAQGIGNVCSGLFGGIPATGAIARTAANVKNGGRTPVAGMVHAVVLALFLVVLMPVAKMIPMPIIAAILFMVAYNMSEWRHFVRICKFSPKSDVIVLVATFVLTVVFDLVVAIAVGLVLAALLFMKRMADVTKVRRWEKFTVNSKGHSKDIPQGVVVYEINGPMFFADADKFLEFTLFDDTQVVIVRMSKVPSIDATAMKNFEILYNACKAKGVVMVLSHINEQPMKVITRSGLLAKLGQDNVRPDIDDALEYAKTLCK